MSIYLKDPQGAIPKGTLLAIVLTTISYLLMAVIAGFTMARDATGNVEDYLNGTFLNCSVGECKYGLQNSFQVSTSCLFNVHFFYLCLCLSL